MAAVPAIGRKTEKGLPQYQDREDSDTFVLEGAEDLVPLLQENGGNWQQVIVEKELAGIPWEVKLYYRQNLGSASFAEAKLVSPMAHCKFRIWKGMAGRTC